MTSPRRRLLIAGAVALVLVVVVGGIAAKYLYPAPTSSMSPPNSTVSQAFTKEIGSPSWECRSKRHQDHAQGRLRRGRTTIDKDVKIPANAHAVTISNSILTDRQVELTAYSSGPVMTDHATIGLNRTKTPVEFARTLDMVNNLAGSVRGDGKGNGPLADLVNSGAEIASGNGQQIKDALGRLSDALRLSQDRGAVTREQLTAIIKSTSSLFDAAQKNDGTLRQFGSYVRQLSDILAEENLGSGTTGKRLNQVLTQVSGILETHRDTIKKLASNGDVSFKTLVEYQRDLSELLDVAPMTLDNLYNIVDQKNGRCASTCFSTRCSSTPRPSKKSGNMMGFQAIGMQHRNTSDDFGPDFD